jgi:hypothetical protein
MSRSRPDQDRASKNPAVRFFKWKSEQECYAYYDKEKEQNITIPNDEFKFIYLDQLATITGFDDAHDSFLWANEIRSGDLKNTPLCVHAGKKEIFNGLYAEVKEKVQSAKYAASVYGMFKVGDDYKIVNVKNSGASLGAWIEFVNEVGIEKLKGDSVVGIVGVDHDKKGRVEYSFPKFGIVSTKLTSEAADKAIELDTELQAYLDVYLASKPTHGDRPEKDEVQTGKGYLEEDPEKNWDAPATPPPSDDDDGDSIPF